MPELTTAEYEALLRAAAELEDYKLAVRAMHRQVKDWTKALEELDAAPPVKDHYWHGRYRGKLEAIAAFDQTLLNVIRMRMATDG